MKLLKLITLIFAILSAHATPLLEQVVAVLKNKPEYQSDKLVQAIVARDLSLVKQWAAKINLNGKPFQTIIDGAYLEALKKASADPEDQQDAQEVSYLALSHTYLSLAIVVSVLDKNEAEKKSSYAIIKELLEHKANPNYPEGADHQTKGLVGKIVGKSPQSPVSDEYSNSLIFEAVFHPCRPEILELLFVYGARPNTVHDNQTLFEHAKELGQTELIPIIEKWVGKAR